MTQPKNLREAHTHLAMHGESLVTPSAAQCATIEDVLAVIRAARHTAIEQGHRWVVVRSLRTEALAERRWPTRAELQSACADLPLMVLSFDHHSCCVNDKARLAADLQDESPNPTGGVIVRDAVGKPTNVLLERACMMVREAVPTPTLAQHRAQLRASLCALAKLGFAEAHDLMSPAWMGPLLARMHDEGDLECEGPDGETVSMRVGLFPLVQDLPANLQTLKTWQRKSRVELLGGKIFVDGTLNARTAWMLEPFAEPLDHHPRGTPLMHTPQIADAIALCTSAGYALAAHAIGDAAVRAVLDAAQLVGPQAQANVRIEHLEIVHEQDIPRFAKLGVIASVQPCHLLYDIEVLQRQLPHTITDTSPSRVLPLKDLLASGLVPGVSLLFGSDVPIVRPNPKDSILAATHRRRITDCKTHGPKSEAIVPSQALDEPTAWSCFTQP
jgi:predicted amidohydrolase YtcJ